MDIRAERYHSLQLFDLTERAVHLLLLLQSPALPVVEQQLFCEAEQTGTCRELRPTTAPISFYLRTMYKLVLQDPFNNWDLQGMHCYSVWFWLVVVELLLNTFVRIVTCLVLCADHPAISSEVKLQKHLSACWLLAILKRKLFKFLNCRGSSSSWDRMYFCPSFSLHKVLEIIFTD